MNEHLKHGILGETTTYPTQYDPSVLYPIARKLGRDAIQQKLPTFATDELQLGMDWWHAFEVSWLNEQGISQVAIARFSIPANTPNIVESKSLKLYLNSLNFTEFVSWSMVEDTIANDLSHCVGGEVTVTLFDLGMFVYDYDALYHLGYQTGLLFYEPDGRCIDDALDRNDEKIPLTDHPDASLLSKGESKLSQSSTHQQTDHQLYSNLLRSNCPVTNQPDWGTLAIEMTTDRQVDYANVLNYILSYRQHNGFHEQCVEQIFADLSLYFEPSKLMVRAWYTRRGGIDINPCRVSDLSLLPKPSRLIRQ